MSVSSSVMQLQSPIGARMVIDGREVDYFCGTSYHAMHGHPTVIAAAVAASQDYGMGAATRADFPVYLDLRAALAEHFGCEDATLSSSGYVSPLVLLQGLQGDFDRLFVDQFAHYAVCEAILTLGVPVHKFAHRDADSLRAALEMNLAPGEVPMVVSDGVFPSTGAIAPLADYCAVMKGYEGALLCVDDAHGVGAIGKTGRGALEFAGVEGPGRHVAATTSKCFGGAGGFVPGSRAMCERLEENVKLLAGSSPPPPAAAAAALAGLTLLRNDPSHLERLAANVRRMRAGLRGLGLDVPESPAPIVNVTAERDLAQVSAALLEQGIAIKRVAPFGYSDARPQEALRIAVFSTHSATQIDRLVAALGALL